MFVSKRMSVNPVTISPSTGILEAMNLMKNNKIRRLPVTEGGKLVGIVTERDLREVSPSPATSLSIYELNYLLAKMQVKDIMKKKVLTIHVDATIEEAALIMYNNKIGGLIVVDNDGGIVGIITETDLFKCFVDVMGLPEGRTRITLEFVDHIGALNEITGVFKDLGINIFSLVVQHLPEGKIEMVIRADTTNVEALAEKLTDKSFTVVHVAQIGTDK